MPPAPLDAFTAATRTWFGQTFEGPTPVQADGWRRIAAGEHALLLAPTGSGKTLAAFLWAIDRLLRLPPDAPAGVRVLYISPLKALVYDIQRNLRAPLVGTLRAAEALGHTCRQVRVDMRTGDTPAADRRRQLRDPADILVTTPESLYLLLGGQAAATFAPLHTVIVDEIHALAPTKRGAHLALSLERLVDEVAALAAAPGEPGAAADAAPSAAPAAAPAAAPRIQRIGLSATVRPTDQVARFLGGGEAVAVVDRAAPPRLDLSIVVPVADMEKPPPPPLPEARGGAILAQTMERPAPPKSREQAGMWAAIHPAILGLIEAHRSTIVFVNSRSLCERLAQRLNELAGRELVRAHHGSVAQRKRAEMEESLKAGELRGIVATSSLELGIDMGHVDLVVLVESPGSVARGLQRVGRAGHAVGARSRGIVLPKFRGDLLECAVVAQRMRAGTLEPIAVPFNALDVLAQQLVATCVRRPMPLGALTALVRRAYPYHALSQEALVAVLDMLSGSYPSDEFAELRPWLSWDRQTDVLQARRGARLTAALSGGTIPDRGLFGVFLAGDGPRVGELDEEMVHESRRGDVIMLGASSWRVEEITRDKVLVTPAPGEPGRMPFWRGEGPGRPIELGRALGAFVREMGALPTAAARTMLEQEMGLDAQASDNLAAYLAAQRAATGTLPTDRSITVERFRDEIGDWRVCILTPFGARVHAPWALALEASLSQQAGFAVQTMHSDDGIVLRFADTEALPEVGRLLLDPAQMEDLVMAQLGHSAMFASAFRENAGRALLLPRRQATARTPLWQQRLRAKMLLAAAQRYPSFPIVLETYRQCLRDVFDLPALVGLLEAIERREIEVCEVETAHASPFARALAFAYVATYLYENDAPAAERRAQALTLDRDLLRELLGQAHLRELLDAAVLDAVEDELQGLAPDRQARDADELHDLLRRLGALDEAAAQARCTVPLAPLAEALQAQRRAIFVRLGGRRCLIACEDAGRYRDALGVMPPGGLPERFLAPVDDALTQLLRRYARCHGPFTGAAAAAALGLLPAQVQPPLAALAAAGTLVHGEMRPGGQTPEWCDAEVLRRVKRATLARLRREVAAVPSAALGRFLPRWHGLEAPRRGAHGLEAVIEQLEGVALPWSAWWQAVLPARLSDFHLDGLDMLCAGGALVWVGAGALGPRDGRVRLLRRAQAGRLLALEAPFAPPTPQHAALMAHLERRGACFTFELMQQGFAEDFAALEPLLWDLVWAGWLTNDTVQPLRGLATRGRPARGGRARRGRAPAVGGRWSKVADIVDPDVSATERSHARAAMLLQRYGVVSREAAACEELPGGFSAVYDVLKAMEESGKVRRGYFVEGMSGAQFAYGGAIERLRARGRDDEGDGDALPQVLATLDPANPYGALLPWPARDQPGSARPRRVGGAYVVLVRGEPLAYLEGQAHALSTFPAAWEGPAQTAAMVTGLRQVAARQRGRALHLHAVDGSGAHGHPRRAALVEAGLVPTFDGLSLEAAAP